MLLATQYYRPPFPDNRYWKSDLAAIRAAGLEAIELWAVWAWIEPERGVYVFDDFDELVRLAAEAGLKVIITAVAEMQPYWIHREIPDGHMVDHTGRTIASSTLSYNPQGLSPGACTDHPRVRELMAQFLEKLAWRFANSPNLMMWDCWNEIRVAVQSDGYYCYCDHSLGAYRHWLQDRHGDLDGLNRAWRRRFTNWLDVPASKGPARSWTESMEWQRFLQDRTAALVGFRADALRKGDPDHPVIAHSVILSSFMQQGESEWDPPESRGNDWQIVEKLDGFGASHFPGWFHSLPSEYGARLESTRSAAGGRPHWVCELQGGGAKNGIHVMTPVTAKQQQRWIWMAFGRGVQGICFWCWRDEVFGRESGGFGVIGDDGHAEARIAAITHSNDVIHEHKALLDDYRPASATVGVIFDSLNHQLEWAQYGKASEQSGRSIKAYLQCLERLNVPYDVIDAAHLGDLTRYRLLFLPWAMVVRPELAAALEAWVQSGGLLVAESEIAAFDAYGFYTYPEERAFPKALGVRGRGRRPVPEHGKIEVRFGGIHTNLTAASWIEPIETPGGTSIAIVGSETVGIARQLGSGSLIVLGTHAGLAYSRERSADFETYVRNVLTAGGVAPELTCSIANGEVVQFRHGCAGSKLLLFVTNEGEGVDAVFQWRGPARPAASSATDLLTGRHLHIEDDHNGAVSVAIRIDAGGSHLIVFDRR